MLDIEFIRENADAVRQAAVDKGADADIDRLLELDSRRRELRTDFEQLQAQQNELSRSMPTLADEERERAKERASHLKEMLEERKPRLEQAEERYEELMLRVPQIPVAGTPVGDEESNEIVREHGAPTDPDFEPKSHIELGRNLGIIDFDRGVKVAGTRSYYLRGMGAMLEMALMQYGLDFISKRGYAPMAVPVVAPERFFQGTGWFPFMQDETFRVADKDREAYLIGSAEVPLAGYHADETLDEADLPTRLAAYSPCFRTEVGSYGRDTQGLFRVRQFAKIEQLILCPADDEAEEAMFAELLKNAEDFLQSLELPYRVMRLATGDMGEGQREKFDIETWMPSREKYSETHSCSRFGDWQARRLNIRYQAGKDRKFAYTLNNTVVASPRIIIPLLELHQRADGSVLLPKALEPYLPTLKITAP